MPIMPEIMRVIKDSLHLYSSVVSSQSAVNRQSSMARLLFRCEIRTNAFRKVQLCIGRLPEEVAQTKIAACTDKEIHGRIACRIECIGKE